MEKETSLTEERIGKLRKMLLRKLKEIPIIQAVCKKVGIGRATYYRWRKEDKKFAERADRAIREGVKTINDLAEFSIISAIGNKDMAAAKFWLKHRHEAYKTRIELSEKSEKSRELTKEQEEAVRRALQLAGIIEDNHGKLNDKHGSKPRR